MRRADPLDQRASGRFVQQVAGVPGDAGRRRRRVAGDGVDVMAALEQEGQAVASDEAAGAGDQHTAHGVLPGA